MAAFDDLREILNLASRALECQAELGHKEIILEKVSPGVAVVEPDEDQPESATEVSVMPLPNKEPQSLFGEETMLTAEPEFESLDAHLVAINQCEKCGLCESRTNFVYGIGNPHADIMFVGEAPGRDEDLQGVPFVGRAGKLLDKILEAMKLSRDDVYIANILKCRPPGNRDPQPDEMQTCIPYLKEQIRLIRPKFLVALGRIAAHGLLETTTPLGRLRGQWHSFDGIPMIVTYHPAALLRFQQYKRPTWEDMQTLMAEYERSK